MLTPTQRLSLARNTVFLDLSRLVPFVFQLCIQRSPPPVGFPGYLRPSSPFSQQRLSYLLFYFNKIPRSRQFIEGKVYLRSLSQRDKSPSQLPLGRHSQHRDTMAGRHGHWSRELRGHILNSKHEVGRSGRVTGCGNWKQGEAVRSQSQSTVISFF